MTPAPSNTSSHTLIGLIPESSAPTMPDNGPEPSEKNSSAIPPLDPPISGVKRYFKPSGALRPLRLLRSDFKSLIHRWPSDWFFNQLILASAVYVFFTNLLPGITFSSDLYVRTDQNYGTIEVVLSTAICGLVFSLYVYRKGFQSCADSLLGSLHSLLPS